MKKVSKEEMQKDAERLMKHHGKQSISATQDGNYFFGQGDAVNHNASLKKADDTWDGEVIDYAVTNTESAPGEKQTKNSKKGKE